jgi:hypothetical protein
MFSLTLEEGSLVGGEASREGDHLRPRGQWTLLAAGGFQGDPELTTQAHG